MSYETPTYSWITMNGRRQEKNTNIKLKKKIYKYNPKSVNNKRLLCKNILNNGSCSYGNVCIYAHSIDEQVLDPARKRAYDILESRRKLYDVNLIKDDELFKTFKQLCYTCDNCVEHRCSGGYNCRNGVFDSKYRICLKDLMDGNCTSRRTIGYCEFIHLTDLGLLSYKEQKEAAELVQVSKTTDVEQYLSRPLHYPNNNKTRKEKISTNTVWDNVPKSVMDGTIRKTKPKEKEVIRDSRYIPPVTGNLLTPSFLKRLYNRKNGINYVSLDSSSDSESSIEDSEEYIRRMKEYHGKDFINRIDVEEYNKLKKNKGKSKKDKKVNK